LLEGQKLVNRADGGGGQIRGAGISVEKGQPRGPGILQRAAGAFESKRGRPNFPTRVRRLMKFLGAAFRAPAE